MWESILGIWLLAIGSVWTVGFLGLFTLWLVHVDRNGWAIVFSAAVGYCIYRVFGFDPTTFWICAASFIPVGIAWSFYRWKRHCRSEVEDFNKRKESAKKEYGVNWPGDDWMDRNLIFLERTVTPGSNISLIVGWIFIWPFSIIDNIVGDLWDAAVTFVKTYLIEFYNSISSEALSKVDRDNH